MHALRTITLQLARSSWPAETVTKACWFTSTLTSTTATKVLQSPHPRKCSSVRRASSQHPVTSSSSSCQSLSNKLSGARSSNMSSDADYMSFLDKANKDTDEGRAQAQSQSGGSKAQFKATDSGSSVPKEIRDACKNEVYVSDADEPFEEVSLKWDKDDGLPDEGT